MINVAVLQAVEQFVKVTQNLSDSELDQPWVWGSYDSEGIRFAFFRTYEELRELAVQLKAARSASGLSTSSTHRILAQYHAAYRDLQIVLLGVGAHEAEQVPAEGEWPLKKIVVHIIEAELGFLVACKYALDRHRSQDGRPAKFPRSTWESIIGRDMDSIDAILGGPFSDLLLFYESLHKKVQRTFSDMKEDELTVLSKYWENEMMSLRFRLHRFDSHLRQHTVQLEKTLVGIGHPPTEAKRLLRMIYSALAEAEGVIIGAWEVGLELRGSVARAIATRADEIYRILAERNE